MRNINKITILCVMCFLVTTITACKTSGTRGNQLDRNAWVSPSEYKKVEGYEFKVPEIGDFMLKNVSAISASSNGEPIECSINLDSLKSEIVARNSQARFANNDEIEINLNLQKYSDGGFFCADQGTTCRAVVIKKPSSLLMY